MTLRMTPFEDVQSLVLSRAAARLRVAVIDMREDSFTSGFESTARTIKVGAFLLRLHTSSEMPLKVIFPRCLITT